MAARLAGRANQQNLARTAIARSTGQRADGIAAGAVGIAGLDRRDVSAFGVGGGIRLLVCIVSPSLIE